MKRILGLLAAGIILSAGCLRAQSTTPALRFDTTGHDFGTIDEANGSVSHSFRYTNTSSQPVVIEEVTTTCGCTAADYTKRPIMPGESGSVTVTFDPTGRTSTFHKTVRIVMAHRQSILSLSVRGTIRLSQTPDQELYELTDDLFANQLMVNFGTVRHGSATQSQTITLYNRRTREVTMQYGVIEKSGCLKINLPARIAPGATATMTITLLDKPDYFGSVRDRIYLVADGTKSLPIQMLGYLVDNMQGVRVTEAPRCQITEGYFNFGVVGPQSSCQHTFTIRNEGQLPLTVRKIESQLPVTTDFSAPTTLKTGASLPVKISVDTQRPGAVDVNLRVVTNDLNAPIAVLKVEGTIR